MVYQVADIKRDVRVCLDQNASVQQLLQDADTDTLMVEDIIASKIADAVEQVEVAAPYYLLEQGHNFGSAVYWEDSTSRQGCGWVVLPDDFMRLVVFEMSDWERPVYEVLSATDPRYAQQRSRYGGVRGNPQRPVCVIGARPGERVLEFYSCKSKDATVRRGIYIPFPEIDANGGIDISRRCYRAAVYMAAGLTLVSLRESEHAKSMFEISNSLLQK